MSGGIVSSETRPGPARLRRSFVLAVWLAGCGTKGFRDKGDWSTVGPERRAVLSSAVAMLGQPYRYGGTVPGQGFDCSGLVYYTHDRAALPVPRTSSEQYRRARPKDA